MLNVVVRTCARIPKKYTFYGLIHAYNLAQLIVDDLIRANTLFLNKEKLQQKKRLARHCNREFKLLVGTYYILEKNMRNRK